MPQVIISDKEVQALVDALAGKQREVALLQALLAEAAWYVDRYGDSRKDRRYLDRFLAASKGEPIPDDDA